MTAHFTDISVNARYDELPGLMASIADLAAGLGVSTDDSLRLQLVIEELFTNTIAHGHQGDGEHKINLALGRNDGILTLRYEDDAPPFDNSQIGQNFRLTVEVGGQGLGLIHGMCKAIRYQRLGQRNITEIEF
ncbi:ATP-binding protein [Ferribacterium limneticum]|uniref:ATP-binding protein n=1 Tax=Ferribacterium limneticum TaxID=76259 RepID=UPI001CF867A1|nr:ATP-binding protein [Ferribacterium limneticum]UCV24861.1 ATP-binding protein [Ferribacterium limneticum]